MATLLPSLSSDEDEPSKHRKENDGDSSEDDDEEVDESFQFGGILVSSLRVVCDRVNS
jgi:hypothetical protein